MPKFSLVSVSRQIFHNFPSLNPDQRDDVLALLEELEKRYGVDFLDQELTLLNAVRITGLKYITARDVFMNLTGENVHDIIALHPILEAQEPVFQKIDLLHEVKDSFPEYPTTTLSSKEEMELVIRVADLNHQNLFQLGLGKSIGEMIIANPKLIYYFMG